MKDLVLCYSNLIDNWVFNYSETIVGRIWIGNKRT